MPEVELPVEYYLSIVARADWTVAAIHQLAHNSWQCKLLDETNLNKLGRGATLAQALAEAIAAEPLAFVFEPITEHRNILADLGFSPPKIERRI